MGGTRVIDAHVADGAGACLDVAKALSRTPTGSDASRYTIGKTLMQNGLNYGPTLHKCDLRMFQLMQLTGKM